MGWTQDLVTRLEKAVGIRFHFFVGFDFSEFIASLKTDTERMFDGAEPAHFMEDPDLCNGCGAALDKESPDTIGAGYTPDDGSSEYTLYWHESCADPEIIAEANEGAEEVDPD